MIGFPPPLIKPSLSSLRAKAENVMLETMLFCGFFLFCTLIALWSVSNSCCAFGLSSSMAMVHNNECQSNQINNGEACRYFVAINTMTTTIYQGNVRGNRVHLLNWWKKIYWMDRSNAGRARACVGGWKIAIFMYTEVSLDHKMLSTQLRRRRCVEYSSIPGELRPK